MSPNVNYRDADVQASEAAVTTPTADAVADATAILHRLTPAARNLLDVAAVAGPSFHAEDVAEVLGEPVPGILGAFREAVEGGFLEPRNGLLSFRSSSLQAALYAAIPEAVRPALHRAIGLVLIGRPGSAAHAASHLVVGLQSGDRAALAALTRAAADLTAPAPAEAADLALRVLELTPPEDEGRLARILVGVGALTAAGRLPEAVALVRAGLASSRLPESVAARLHLKLSALHLAGGRTADAVAEAEAALGLVRPSSMVETVIAVAPDPGTRPTIEEAGIQPAPADVVDAAHSARVLALLCDGDTAGAEVGAEAILAGRRGPGDAGLVTAVSALAVSSWTAGRVRDALGLARAAVVRASGHGSAVHPRVMLGAMLQSVGEFREAGSVLDQATDDVESGGDVLWSALPAASRALLHAHQGDLSQAAFLAQAALDISAQSGTVVCVPQALGVLARVDVHRGDFRGAQQHLDDYRRASSPSSGGRNAGIFRWTEALVLAAGETPQAACQQLLGLYEAVPVTPSLLLEESWAAAWLTRLALSAGDRQRATSSVTCAQWLADVNPGVAAVAAAAAHVRGLLERSPPLLEAAGKQYPQVWSRGSAWEDQGVICAGLGETQEAIRALGDALDAYVEMGAEHDAARVRSRLRDMGVHRSHWRRLERPVCGWQSLTDTELRVAGIVAEGLTNAQVAERLFVSRHTVDFHLRQIFRKLAVRSRTELARVLVEQESTAAPGR
jgi:DNA-binding CsgD family transcriptional regulator